MSGGQFAAHAPEHALLLPLSAPKRYSVRPFESTRTAPRSVFATATVADLSLLAVEATAPALSSPLLPQAAVSSVSGTSSTLAMVVMGRLRIMFVPWVRRGG